MVVENWFSKMEIDREKNYCNLRIDGLQQGTYNLKFMSGHTFHTVKVTVHKGEEWDEGFILKKHSLQESVAQKKIVKIKDASISESKPGVQNVSV